MVVASELFEMKSEFEMFKCLLLEENIFKTQVKGSKAHALIVQSNHTHTGERLLSVGGPLALHALKSNNSFTRGSTSSNTRV